MLLDEAKVEDDSAWKYGLDDFDDMDNVRADERQIRRYILSMRRVQCYHKYASTSFSILIVPYDR